ncbi:MAG TPA: aminopeptidase [Burkholderiales bacterium]|nr:aminopeptidase [Burkholderiales bacterium]
MRKPFKWMLLLLPLLGGCANFGFYWQSVSGQMEIWKKEQHIETLLADQSVTPELKLRLQSVLDIREFASRELGLPDNGSYRLYADLQRPYVLWNVFATPEFSIRPKEWCFVIAGCVNYRGYFSEADAQAFADNLHREGDDVFVAGVPAYSTLGWFDDPVLSTFIYFPETEVARLIFHELAHQLVYVPDDSTFNESFATAVEETGVERWLDKNGNDELRSAFAAAQVRKKDFIALMLQYRGQLQGLYASEAGEQQKRESKASILRKLKQEYAALKIKWGSFSDYDRWFAQDLNNAHLASVAAYTQLVPAFQHLLAQQQGDLPAFYAAVKEIAKLPKSERLARLEER